MKWICCKCSTENELGYECVECGSWNTGDYVCSECGALNDPDESCGKCGHEYCEDCFTSGDDGTIEDVGFNYDENILEDPLEEAADPWG